MSNFYTYARHYGDKILLRGVTSQGKRISKKVSFSPTLFVRSDKPTQYKTMFGEKVSPVEFASNKEASEFVEQYKEVSNFPIFGQTH